jgi:hypothetical protein
MHMNKKHQGKSNAFSHCAYCMFDKMKMKFTIHNMMSFTRFNGLFYSFQRSFTNGGSGISSDIIRK